MPPFVITSGHILIDNHNRWTRLQLFIDAEKKYVHKKWRASQPTTTKQFKLNVHFFEKVNDKTGTVITVSGNPCTPLKTTTGNIKINNYKNSFKAGCLLSFLRSWSPLHRTSRAFSSFMGTISFNSLSQCSKTARFSLCVFCKSTIPEQEQEVLGINNCLLSFHCNISIWYK